MTKRWAPAVALIGAALLVWLLAAQFWWRAEPKPDVVSANDVLHAVQDSWGALSAGQFPPDAQFSVVDLNESLVYFQQTEVTNQLAAVSAGANQLDVVVDGQLVGYLYWVDEAIAEAQQFHEVSGWVLAAAIGGLTFLGLLVLWWVDRRVLRPFARLAGFASQVAAGDLNTPLPMERGNAFGAFTEAFDLMRDSLKRAKEAEAEVTESKRTLVSQLGHDIRTPLASIQTTAEVAKLQNTDPDQASRLGVILTKSAQINALLDDLFQANAEQLSVLGVDCIEVSTAELARLILSAALVDQSVLVDLPEALVSVDPLRMRQVLDNVLSNAAKYAGTPVLVAGRIEGDHLCVSLTDHGPGLDSAEVSLVVGRGVRGSNSTNIQGSGLGLFTSAWLLEHMGGTLVTALPPEGGFQVQLWLPLAGR